MDAHHFGRTTALAASGLREIGAGGRKGAKMWGRPIRETDARGHPLWRQSKAVNRPSRTLAARPGAADATVRYPVLRSMTPFPSRDRSTTDLPGRSGCVPPESPAPPEPYCSGGEAQLPDILQNLPKSRFRREAHSSIRTQEGEPNKSTNLGEQFGASNARTRRQVAGLTPRELEVRFQICVHWTTATNDRPRVITVGGIYAHRNAASTAHARMPINIPAGSRGRVLRSHEG